VEASTILVTGGAGFVGSNLCLAFREFWPETRIVALDNLRRRGSELNVPRLEAADVEFVRGDVRRSEDLQFEDLDLIVECSAEPSVLAGRDGGTDYVVHTNLLGTYNCLELCRRTGAGMVFLSTSRVYPMGALGGLPLKPAESRFVLPDGYSAQGVSEIGIAESFPLDGARSLYGATKLSSELLITEYVEMFDLPIVVNRCGVLTGPWQMGKVDQGVVVLWMARHIFGGKLDYIGYGGDGKQVRDILHVQDLADLLKLQIDSLCKHKGKTYNVGGGPGISVSLQELTDLCREISGKTIEIGSVPGNRAGDVPWYVTDSTRVREATGWSPQHGVEEILRDVHQWICENREELKPILG
jgi:CDP-paratose 2-epimerase